MKKEIKQLLIRLSNPLITRLGYVRPAESPNHRATDKGSLLQTFFNLLTELNFAPKHIVDIGANHGKWTREAMKFFPASMYTLVEPQSWLKASIQDVLDSNPRVQFYSFGMGAQAGKMKFTLTERDDSCSFLYSEEHARRNGLEQIEIPVLTLQEFLDDRQLPVPDIIKIDAEGLDLEVLQGAGRYLGETEVFMVEAAVNHKSFYNTVLKTINFMESKGYRLFDITDINRPLSVKILWLVELVFIKQGGAVERAVKELAIG